MNKFFAVAFVLFALVLTGCMTVANDIPLYIETPGVPYKKVAKEYISDATGTKVTSTEVEETVITAPMLEYELKLQALRVQLEVARKANLSYHPASNWYGGGGGVTVVNPPSGYNRNYSNGGGTSSGNNGGSTVITGNGGSNNTPNHPSGSNTSGGATGQPVGIGPGGTNNIKKGGII